MFLSTTFYLGFYTFYTSHTHVSYVIDINFDCSIALKAKFLKIISKQIYVKGMFCQGGRWGDTVAPREQISIIHFNEYTLYNGIMMQSQHIVIYLWTDWHTEQWLGVTCQEAVECKYKQRDVNSKDDW